MAAITREEATALRDVPDRPGGTAVAEHAAPIGGLTRARLLFKAGAHELLLRGDRRLDDLYRAKFDGRSRRSGCATDASPIQYKGSWPFGTGATGATRRRAQRRRSRGTSRSSAGRRQAPGQVRDARPALVRADRAAPTSSG